MYRLRKNHLRRRKGFTLIELLVSLVIFVMFMGVVSSSFVSIVRAEKDTNEVRKMYSEVRSFVEDLSEEARLGTIDYACYAVIAAAYNASICPPVQLQSISEYGRTTDLELARKDGMEETIFRYDAKNKKVLEQKFVAVAGGNWAPAPGFEDGFREVMGNLVQVDRLVFAINPDVDPYSANHDVYSNNAKQFQPKVTLFMGVSSPEGSKTPLSLDLETTISSRVYSRS